MSSALENGSVYCGHLPVLLEPLDALPQEQDLLLANAGNELLLRTVTVLEEKAELDETEPLSVELHRQDLKLSLLLDMVGSLLLQNRILPPPRMVVFTAERLRFEGNLQVTAPGQYCRISLYIEPGVPRALVLFGQLQPDTTMLVFNGVNQQVRDQIDKYIFRHHRRLVAMARQAH